MRVSQLENAKGEIFGVLFLSRDVTPETEREQRLTELMMRERDIATLVPDGLIYVLTDESDGKLIRLQPVSE